MQVAFRLIVGSILLVLIAFWSAQAQIIPYDPNTMFFPVTPEQATASARGWIGDPEMPLVLEGVCIDSGDPMYYVLDSEDGVHYFWVDCETSEVRLWQDKVAAAAYAAKQQNLWPESSKMPIAQLNSIVRDFLIAHYPQFESLNMQPVQAGSASSAYQQLLPNGAYYCLSYAGCSVDEWSGVVTRYIGRHSPPPAVSTTPIVDSQEAEQIALDYGGTISVHDDDSEDPAIPVLPQSAFVLTNGGLSIEEDSLGVQRLSWAIDVVLHPTSGYTATEYYDELNDPEDPGFASGWEVIISIDAITGEVFYSAAGGYAGVGPSRLTKQKAATIRSRRPNPSALKGQPLHEKGEILVDGMALDLKYPVRSVGGAGYLYAKYLPLLYSGTIQWRNRAAELTVAGRSATLHPGSKLVSVGGKTIKLEDPVALIGDRVYVPYQAIPHLCGVTAAWDKQSRTLRISSGDVSFKPGSRLSIARSVYAKQRSSDKE